MSARSCGCDDENGWICKNHGDEIEAARLNRIEEGARVIAEKVVKEQRRFDESRTQRFNERLAQERAAKIASAAYRAPAETGLTPLDVSLLDAQTTLGALIGQMSTLERRVEELQDENVALRGECSRHLAERMADAGSSFERELNAVYDRARVAAILATFYRAELSMSSVAPVLALAEALNPSLRAQREQNEAGQR